MKKKLTLFIMMLAALLSSSSAWAQTFIQGDMKYTVLDADAKTVSVAKANNDITGNITIPSTVTNGNVAYTVTTIKEYGFQDARIASITIPATVEKMEFYAFQGCSSLAKVTIQDSDTPIEFVTGYSRSFGGTLKEVYIGRDVNRTGDYFNDRMFDNVTKVTFGPKVTAIPNNFMSGQDNMNTLVIGDGVKTIGDDAFAGDRYGEPELSVTMGANVESIGARAFQTCFTLKSITLPAKLKTIGAQAFESTGITSITIPASVTDIEYYAFLSCGQLTSINFEDSDEPVNFVTGYARSFGTSDKEIYIGRDINRTGDYAGACLFDNVTKVTFGPKVTAIPNNFMSGQDKMHTLIIGDGVKTIGDDAFAGDRYGEPELSVTMGANVESIGARAFQTCFALKSITLPAKLKTIGSQAFDGTYITSLTIPASVTDIENYAFRACNQLTSIKFEDSDEPVNFVTGYELSFGNAPKTVYIGRNINRTGDYFSWRLFNNVTDLTIGDKVTEIPNNMFDGNSELQNVTIGTGVKYIGESAFRSCGTSDTVEELKVEMGVNVDSLATYAFQNCTKLKTISLPSTLNIIESYAFQNSGLTALSIPASVKRLGFYAFQSCESLTNINIEESDEPLEFVTGYSLSFGGTAKTVYIGRNINRTGDYFSWRIFNNVTDLTIGDKVTEIPNNMFDGNNELQNVTIGTGVKYLGESAFRSCGTSDDVTELKVEMGVNVDSLAANAFQNCTKLKTISLPSTLNIIESYAFQNCGLTSLSIPASVKRLGFYAFQGCESLTSVRIEESTEPLEFVTGYSISFGSAAKEVFMGRNVNRTGDYANYRLFNKVTKLTIGDKVTEIGPNMFNGNSELTVVNVAWKQPIGIDANVFNNTTYQTATLFVPGGTMDAYKADAVWSKFLKMEASSYFVTGTATAGGTLAFAGLTVTNDTKSLLVDRETDVVFEVTPAENYDFTSLTVDGTAVNVTNNIYTYPNLLKDIDVKATFIEKPKFDIKATATGGTVSLNGANFSASQSIKVYRDTDVTLSVAPAEGYQQKPAKVTVNGVDVTAQLQDNTLKIENIQEAKTIVVTFAKLQFAITTEQTQNGSIELSKQTVEWGDSFTATFKPATGYELATATLNGEDVTAQVKDNVLTVSDVKEAKSVGATFKKLTFQIAAEQTKNGSIELSASTVEWGDSFTATFKPATGYELLTATVNGEDVTADVENNVLTVSDVRVNVTVGATFQKQTYAVTISGGGVTVSNLNPQYGDNVTVTIEDDPDRTLVSLLVNGQDVTAQVKDGQYIIYNVTGNVTVEATFKSTKEFITLTGEYATFSCPQDLNFAGSNLCAYIASGFNKATGQALLTRVYDVPAGTGIFLVGEPGTTYKIPYSTTSSIYMNFFVANLQKSTVSATTGNFSNYTFGEQAGDPGFYPVSGSTTLLAQTAYLQLPTNFVAPGVKVSVIFEEDIIDGIEDFRISNEDAEIYDLAGRRLHKAQKGIYIINGKKTLVK